MNLNYAIPNNIYPHISLINNEIIHYFVPFDLQTVNSLKEGGYILVTNYRILVLDTTQKIQEYNLKDFTKITCESMIGCGLLIGTMNNVDILLAKFSMKHMIRYSYIARGAYSLSQKLRKDLGMPYTFSKEQLSMEITSKEPEKYCHKCNRALNSSHVCPKCENHMVTLKSFIQLCKPYLSKWILISILMLVMACFRLYMPFIQKDFIDSVLQTGSGTISDILRFVGIMISLTFIVLIVDIIKYKETNALGAKISMDLRKKLYTKIQTLSLSFLNTQSTGDIMNRVIQDTSEIRKFMESTFGEMCTVLITMIGSLLLMLSMDVKLTIFSTMFIIFSVAINYAFHKKIRVLVHHLWRKKDKLNTLLQDVISGIRVVKTFGKEEYEITRFYDSNKDYAEFECKLERFWAIFNPIVNFVMGIGIYFAIYFGGKYVLNGQMTTGELIQFTTYANSLYGPLGWITFLPRRIIQMLTSYERINQILEEEPEIKNHLSSEPHCIEGNIEFDHVYFGYKVYDTVLEDLNFKVEKGEMIGLVGSSGAGKSTLINLIMRLYNVNQGAINIDGKNINDITIESLHSQIGVVLQETFLFSGSILNNIRYAKPTATIEEVIHAAKVANAHDFISMMPDGYNTYVGEKGYNLSGGEKQRIAIARAILHDPKILILDEATSALDTESEYLIQQALDRLTKGRTTFAIAHRLSTLRNANRLIVIDGKKIAEIGTHNELLEQKGIYYKLVSAQLEMQKIENIKDLYDITDNPADIA